MRANSNPNTASEDAETKALADLEQQKQRLELLRQRRDAAQKAKEDAEKQKAMEEEAAQKAKDDAEKKQAMEEEAKRVKQELEMLEAEEKLRTSGGGGLTDDDDKAKATAGAKDDKDKDSKDKETKTEEKVFLTPVGATEKKPVADPKRKHTGDTEATKSFHAGL